MPRRSNKPRKKEKERKASTSTSTSSTASRSTGYVPPTSSTSIDVIDEIVSKVDEGGNDKYRAVVTERMWSMDSQPIPTESLPMEDSLGRSAGTMKTQYDDEDAVTTDDEDPATTDDEFADAVMSVSTEEPHRRVRHSAEDLYQILEDGDYYSVKQKFSYASIIITALQILVLMVQLSMCGVAPLDVNPFVGPFPDAVSDWGGKNAYLLKEHYEYWRLATPAFLHVGVLHLLVNAAVQLETCAFFEREWGSTRYVWIYLVSEVGCVLTSSAADPETIAVGSSGALMGLFGAKLAQVLTQTLFESRHVEDDAIQLEQLSSVMCSLAVIFILSFFTYIDWSGHMGGMGTGFAFGIVVFAPSIISLVSRFIWQLLGIIAFVGGVGYVSYYFFTLVEPDQELGDACEYFRNLFVEGYDCKCLAFG